jgi:hypothetical protein
MNSLMRYVSRYILPRRDITRFNPTNRDVCSYNPKLKINSSLLNNKRNRLDRNINIHIYTHRLYFLTLTPTTFRLIFKDTVTLINCMANEPVSTHFCFKLVLKEPKKSPIFASWGRIFQCKAPLLLIYHLPNSLIGKGRAKSVSLFLGL